MNTDSTGNKQSSTPTAVSHSQKRHGSASFRPINKRQSSPSIFNTTQDTLHPMDSALSPTGSSDFNESRGRTPVPGTVTTAGATAGGATIDQHTDTHRHNRSAPQPGQGQHAFGSRGGLTAQQQQQLQTLAQQARQQQQRGSVRRQSSSTLLSTGSSLTEASQRSSLPADDPALATNLQDTYKAILKLEVETQQGCSEVNQRLIENDAGAEITTQLWVVYKNVVRLLDHYYDFLLFALAPGSVRAGKPVVTNYRILRRMWVYGVVSFLEVLKNVAAIFVEHEICACFIAYAFNIISCLTEPELGIQGWWCEKLGDLSRMAIALYPGRYMDWKSSSVAWYRAAMRTQFGHGKIYYHACTVETDNLEALVDIGKSVTCRDPFVPTQQYLRMIVDNVCSQRNILSSTEMAMIDFVKVHKILLLPSYNSNPEMVNLVSHYATHFGLDTGNVDFFQLRGSSGPVPEEKLQFWYQKSANFALANINHLIGFGDSRNPFAKLFGLPEALRQRKERKDRRRKSTRAAQAAAAAAAAAGGGSAATAAAAAAAVQAVADGAGSEARSIDEESETLFGSTASDQDETSWFGLLDFVNKGVLELTVRMLRQYVTGPLQTSMPHVIVSLYFVAAIGCAIRTNSSGSRLFVCIIRRFYPWSKVVPYLNDMLYIIRSNEAARASFHSAMEELANRDYDMLEYLATHEQIWEAWKCWGSLWFDAIVQKKDYNTQPESGVPGEIFDVPSGGPRYDAADNSPRYICIATVATFIALQFPEFGLAVESNVFKYSLAEMESSQLSPEESSRFEMFCQDNRFREMFDKPGDMLIAQNSVDNVDAPLDLDVDRWAGPNMDPQLPTLEANSYGFMTEVINNQSPSFFGDKADEAMASEADDEEDYSDMYSQQGAYHPADALAVVGDMGEGMDSSVTYVSLDTNTWLKHCGRVFKCVRFDVFKLSVPLTVFQELRSLRRSTDASVADSATRAVIIIRQLSAEKEVLPVRADGSKASSLNETLEFEQNQNWRSNTDEIIMKAIKLNDDLGKSLLLGNLHHINRGGKVLSRVEASVFKYNVLVTDDRNMGVRAHAMKLTTFPSSWLLSQIEKLSLSKGGACAD